VKRWHLTQMKSRKVNDQISQRMLCVQGLLILCKSPSLVLTNPNTNPTLTVSSSIHMAPNPDEEQEGQQSDFSADNMRSRIANFVQKSPLFLLKCSPILEIQWQQCLSFPQQRVAKELILAHAVIHGTAQGKNSLQLCKAILPPVTEGQNRTRLPLKWQLK